MQISHGNIIVGRVELTALRSGRADTSVNLRSIRLASISGGRFGRTMQLTIIAIIAIIKPLTFSYIRMAGQVVYAAHDA
jgi:hypothetical protein